MPGPRQENCVQGSGLRARERARSRKQGCPCEIAGDGRVRPLRLFHHRAAGSSASARCHARCPRGRCSCQEDRQEGGQEDHKEGRDCARRSRGGHQRSACCFGYPGDEVGSEAGSTAGSPAGAARGSCGSRSIGHPRGASREAGTASGQQSLRHQRGRCSGTAPRRPASGK